MPEQLPQDGCIPVYAPDHPLKCRRHHLLCIPLAGADEPGHQCRQFEPQFQRLEQSVPGAKKQPVCSNYSNRTKPIPQRNSCPDIFDNITKLQNSSDSVM